MRLLIITQKVDINDDILGFFHRWLIEFAKHYEFITVIALQVGEYNLPNNIKVLSLGKEQKKDSPFLLKRTVLFLNKIKYIFNFYKYIWQERKNYDAVFVHMNQEYVLLGGILWKLLGKKITMWRNHAKGNFITRLAVLFSDKVFCTSAQSFTARFKKTKIMPVGIDTDFFKPDSSIYKKPNSILFLGRIASVKNVDIFVEALRELRDIEVEFSATIAGDASQKDEEYEKMIRDKVLEYGLSDKVTFTGAVSQSEALKLYREHELYVNLTLSGSMDKTIFEAMACEITPVVSNSGLSRILDPEFLINNLDIKNMVEKLKRALNCEIENDPRKFVVENHSLYKLSLKLSLDLKNNE